MNIALETFLAKGFEQTTVEEIAGAIGMSKRTVYARYADKAALFTAAVHRAVDRYTMGRQALERVESDDLAATLKAVARLRIQNLSDPSTVRLQRVLNAYSDRFPELAQAAMRQGTEPVIDYLTDLLVRHDRLGVIMVDEPHRAATAFLSLVVGGPARLIILGNRLDDDETERRIAYSVRLFLRGLRPD